MSKDLRSQTSLGKRKNDERGVQERGDEERSMGLEVYFRDYAMVEIEKCSMVPVLFGGENSNLPNNDHREKILGLELISRLQRRTRGLKHLTSIHGVELENENEDKHPGRSLTKEILKEVLEISRPMVSQPQNVVEKDVNTFEKANKAMKKESRSGSRKTRSSMSKGKRTVLSWIIAMRIIRPYETVCYMDHKRERVLMSGDIVGDGIMCYCCFKVVSISQFDAHSRKKVSDQLVDMSEFDHPLRNMYVNRGRSLLRCLVEAWNKQKKSSATKFYNDVRLKRDDQNDVICSLCGNRGELVCCDSCPSTFHQSCLDIQTLTSGDWHCMYCCCKFCGLYGGNNMGSFQLSSCRLCQQKYHESCFEATGANTAHSRDTSFCGDNCKELYERLEKLLGVKHDIKDGFSWSFICRSDVDSNMSHIEPRKVECNAKLAVALSVMNESFRPCIDDGSGINLIHSVLYNCGSNFPRLDYKRFFTAILERDDEITSVASIRIHGNQLAEMPFVTTRSVYRKEGMFSRLLNAIETELSLLNVELLVIPAISQVKEMWIHSFGFEPLDLRSKRIIKRMNLLVIHGTEMLQKKIPKPNFPHEN